MAKRIKIKKIKRIPLVIAEHSFFTSLALFLLSLIIGFALFYKYNSLAQRIEFEALEAPCVLDEGSYQKVLETWKENERIFQEVDSKQYLDPF